MNSILLLDSSWLFCGTTVTCNTYCSRLVSKPIAPSGCIVKLTVQSPLLHFPHTYHFIRWKNWQNCFSLNDPTFDCTIWSQGEIMHSCSVLVSQWVIKFCCWTLSVGISYVCDLKVLFSLLRIFPDFMLWYDQYDFIFTLSHLLPVCSYPCLNVWFCFSFFFFFFFFLCFWFSQLVLMESPQ